MRNIYEPNRYREFDRGRRFDEDFRRRRPYYPFPIFPIYPYYPPYPPYYGYPPYYSYPYYNPY